MAVNIDAWEHSKENILPMKAGRKAAALARAFGQPSGTLEEERRSFQDKIEGACSSEDPLAPWLEYYEWAKESFPSSRREQLLVLQSATKLFRNDTRYHQDERFLRLWIIYVRDSLL